MFSYEYREFFKSTFFEKHLRTAASIFDWILKHSLWVEDVIVFTLLRIAFVSLAWTEAAVRRCSSKLIFLKILQNSQENTCARISLLIKLQAPPPTLLKKRLWCRCFPVNFAKISRTPLGDCFCMEMNGDNTIIFLTTLAI